MAATDMSKFNKRQKERTEYKKQREERKKGKLNFKVPPEGWSRLALLPPHESMDGLPYVARGRHRSCGPENKTEFICLRHEDQSPLNDCPQCEEVVRLYTTGQERDKIIASKKRRNQRYYWQCCSLEIMADNDPPKMPDCFLQFPADEDDEDQTKKRKKVCSVCAWKDDCVQGIMPFSMGVLMFDDIVDLFEQAGDDITNLKALRGIKFKRTGEGQKTKYTGISLLATLEFPKAVRKHIEDNLIDLTLVSPSKTKEEIKALMEGVETGKANDEDDNEETPDCYGEYDPEMKKCGKCQFSDACEIEVSGKAKKSSKDDDDDDEEPPKKKKAKVEEDEDEDEEPPKKKKAKVEDDDEDEEPPKKKKAKAKVEDDDDEDDEPPKKKKAKVEDDDDEDDEPPKKKKAKVEDDDDEDDDDDDEEEEEKKGDDDDDDDDEEELKLRKKLEGAAAKKKGK